MKELMVKPSFYFLISKRLNKNNLQIKLKWFPLKLKNITYQSFNDPYLICPLILKRICAYFLVFSHGSQIFQDEVLPSSQSGRIHLNVADDKGLELSPWGVAAVRDVERWRAREGWRHKTRPQGAARIPNSLHTFTPCICETQTTYL